MKSETTAVLAEAKLWYFLTDMLLTLVKEYSIDETTLHRYLSENCSEAEASRAIQLTSEKYQLDMMALALFDALPSHIPVVGALSSILESHGYSHTNPQTRGLMGKKMFDSVTTTLLTADDKCAYVEAVGNLMIQIIIARE